MKTLFKLIAILFFTFAALNVFSQIPNSGFENWTTVGAYQDPTFWGSTNSYSSGAFYAVTKSTDHYPATVGAYSARIASNTSYVGTYFGRGFLATGAPPPNPDFPISGHPTSLTGYYKYAPLNGDTMFIQIQLYKNGSSVAYGQLSSTSAASGWTSFTIPINSYVDADSGSIFLSSYYANGFNYVPHGNSVLFVDNLNFDVLISGISELTPSNNIIVSPNPFSTETTLQTEKTLHNATLTVYNYFGEPVKQINNLEGSAFTLYRDNLPKGLYFIYLTEGNSLIATQKLIVAE